MYAISSRSWLSEMKVSKNEFCKICSFLASEIHFSFCAQRKKKKDKLVKYINGQLTNKNNNK